MEKPEYRKFRSQRRGKKQFVGNRFTKNTNSNNKDVVADQNQSELVNNVNTSSVSSTDDFCVKNVVAIPFDEFPGPSTAAVPDIIDVVPVVVTFSDKKLSSNFVDIINKNVDDNEIIDMIYLIYLLVHNVKKLVLLELSTRKDFDLQLNAK